MRRATTLSEISIFRSLPPAGTQAAIFLGVSALALWSAAPAAAQFETELRAKAQLFGDAGGVTAIRRDDARRYFLLPSRGTAVLIFDAQGHRTGQIPPASAAPATKSQTPSSLQYGVDLDVACLKPAGAPCLVYVADRGGNAIRVFNANGALLGSISVAAPASVVALPDGEVAVTTMRPARLVQVYNAAGKLAREFGVQEEIAEGRDLNRFLNIGRLATDAAGHVYYAFFYVPEPTVRKYDRFGYLASEIQLATLDFQPTAQAARRAISRQDVPGGRAPILNRVINAIGVDPETQDVWLAVGGVLVRLDSQGNRRATYRIFTAQGARIEPSAILVEADRLLVGSETLGVFEFPRPDKRQP